MRLLIQRVLSASVIIDGLVTASIGNGLLIFAGIEESDNAEDVSWLCNKVINLRVFNDDEGVMNLSVNNVNGGLLVVSQFTLHASTRKGNRPSYIRAARPETAIPLYGKFIEELSAMAGKPVESGTFGADMKVHLVNDGPVTIFIDSKNRE